MDKKYTRVTDILDDMLDYLFDIDDDVWTDLAESIDISHNPKLVAAVKAAAQNPKILFENPRVRAALEKRYLAFLGSALEVVGMINDPDEPTDEDY